MPSTVATAICTIAPGIAMARTESRSCKEKCRPTPNISRITPISASSAGQRGVGDKARRERTDQHAGEQVADDRRGPEPVRQRPEDKGEDEARDESSDQRRVMRHRGSFRYPRRAKPSSRVAEPTVQPCTTSEAITRMKMLANSR